MTKEASRAVSRRGKVRRGLKPRTKDTYTNEAFGQADSNVWSGDYTLNLKLCRMNVIRPRAKEGVLVARFWPSLDYEQPDKRLERGRTSAEPRGQGHWIRRVPSANYIGVNDGRCEKCTFLLYTPGDQEAKAADPYRAFYFACKQAFDSSKFANGRTWLSEWNKLMKGKKGEGAAISKPGATWFALGECYLNGEKDYLEDRELPLGADPADDLVVFQLQTSVGDSMFEVLDREKKAWDGDPEKDPSGPYLVGDPCGVFDPKARAVKGGLFFTIWNPKRYRFKPPEKTIHSWDGKIVDIQGYETMVRKTYVHEGETYTPDLDSARVDNIFSRSQFWYPDDTGEEEGLLRFLSVEEKYILLAKAYKTVPKLYQFALADRWDDVPDEAKAVLTDRVSAASPGIEGEDEDEDEDEETPRRRKKKSRKDPTQEKEIDTEGDDEFPEEGGAETEETEEEESEETEEGDEFETEETEEESEEEETEETEEGDEFEGDDEDEEPEEEESEEEEPEEGDEFEEESEDEETEEETEDEEPAEEGDEFEGSEEEEEAEDEETEEEEPEDEEYFGSDEEEEGASAEFDPEAEASEKEKAMKEKMARSQAAAEGRSKKRGAAKAPPAPEPPAAKPSGKKGSKTGKPPAKADKPKTAPPAAEKPSGKKGAKPEPAAAGKPTKTGKGDKKPAPVAAGKKGGKTGKK